MIEKELDDFQSLSVEDVETICRWLRGKVKNRGSYLGLNKILCSIMFYQDIVLQSQRNNVELKLLARIKKGYFLS